MKTDISQNSRPFPRRLCWAENTRSRWATGLPTTSRGGIFCGIKERRGDRKRQEGDQPRLCGAGRLSHRILRQTAEHSAHNGHARPFLRQDRSGKSRREFDAGADSRDHIQRQTPAYAPSSDQKAVADAIYDASGIPAIDCTDRLYEGAAQGQIYYRTDHHWTTLGAYYGYLAYCDAKNMTPVSLESMEAQTVTEDFAGTLYSKVNDYSHPKDAITIYTNPADDLTVTYADTGEVTDRLYNLDYVAEKDKYSLSQQYPSACRDREQHGGLTGYTDADQGQLRQFHGALPRAPLQKDLRARHQILQGRTVLFSGRTRGHHGYITAI